MNTRVVQDEQTGAYWKLNDSTMTRTRLLKRNVAKKGEYIRLSSHAGILRFKVDSKAKPQSRSRSPAKKVLPKTAPKKKVPKKRVPEKKKTSRKTRKKRAVSPACSNAGRTLRACRRR